jgi:hypothetical protein
MRIAILQLLVSTLGLILLSACGTSIAERKIEKKYFDLTGFVQQQSRLLAAARIPIERVRQIGKTTATTDLPDSLSWESALSILPPMDINKPVLQGRYEVSATDAGKRHTVSYIAKDERLLTRLLSVTSNSTQQVQEIYVRYRDQNMLYEIEKEVTLLVKQDTLRRVVLKGTQKMLFNSPTTYQMVISAVPR